MTDRATIAKQAAEGLREYATTISQVPIVLGFDGFVDSIIKVVETRQDADHYDAVPTIARLGEKISAAAGRSSNYELVTTLRKLGGNGPIMANAMAAAGFKTTYIGALGYPAPDDVFSELVDRAEVHTVAEPGFTDALEFDDGKLMLGKYAHLGAVDDAMILDRIGEEAFKAIVERSRLLGVVNWVMMPGQIKLWRYFVDTLLPSLTALPDGKRRIVFIDLADPEKRTREDLAEALKTIGELAAHADVVFGTNLKEAGQVADVLGLGIDGGNEEAIESTAAAIREAMGIYASVVHPRRGAAAARLGDGGAVETASFAGPFVAEPKLSTGAGDNFNAGFCLGLLAGLSLEQALCVGTGTSGYYVRNAASPTLDQLAAFCDDLPAPQ